MLRPYLGNIGHISVIIAFVAAFVSTYAYWQSSKEKSEPQWLKFARWAFYVHSIAIVSVCASLFSIIFNHYFEYHYAWDNSSWSLPLGYAISCFWQDQEGSFLLWMFWNVVLGIILILIYRIYLINPMHQIYRMYWTIALKSDRLRIFCSTSDF